MREPSQKDKAFARQARIVAIVIAATGVIWMVANAIGPEIGLDPSYAILFDLAALAAFFWALVVAWRLWRVRNAQD
jgi:hypothetical protein